MKSRFLSTLSLLALALVALPQPARSGQSGQSSEPGSTTLTGEVMDTMCAPSKSHTAMMRTNPNMGHDKETCTQQCIKLGGKYVLYDQATGNVYTLNDPAKVESFAGRKVRITGTLTGKNVQVANVNVLG